MSFGRYTHGVHGHIVLQGAFWVESHSQGMQLLGELKRELAWTGDSDSASCQITLLLVVNNNNSAILFGK